MPLKDKNKRRKKRVFIVPPEMRGTMPNYYEPEEREEDVNEYVVQSSYKGK